MNNRIILAYVKKLSWAPCTTIICRHSSSSTLKRHKKSSNHYDSLEIKTDATHNEIKSAYFKLSKQYHPDMNDSPEAKLKFNDISSAYEVLGNHGKRKQYDRGLRITRTVYDTTDVTMKETDFGDLHAQAKRAQAEILRNRTQEDGTPIYNFDAWTEKHYGKLFDKRRRELLRAKEFMDNRAKQQSGEVPLRREIPVFSVLTFILFILMGIRVQFSDLDTPPIKLVNQEKTRVEVNRD